MASWTLAANSRLSSALLLRVIARTRFWRSFSVAAEMPFSGAATPTAWGAGARWHVRGAGAGGDDPAAGRGFAAAGSMTTSHAGVRRPEAATAGPSTGATRRAGMRSAPASAGDGMGAGDGLRPAGGVAAGTGPGLPDATSGRGVALTSTTRRVGFWR